jgi:hypothetical protein
MTKVNEIDLVQAGRTPAELISEAVKGNANLEQLEKLLTLQERWEANEARKAYAFSFAKVQEEIDAVVKTKINPQTHSKYADLGDIIEGVKPVYTKSGFSVIFYEGEAPIKENIRICADVLHEKGHKETYHLDVPLDGVGIKGNANMTAIHGKGSSVSYGRRYLMCMIWNIPTSDNDAAGVGIEFISQAQQHQIADKLIEINAKLEPFLKYLGVESLDKLPKTKFQQAIKAIEEKAKVKK